MVSSAGRISGISDPARPEATRADFIARIEWFMLARLVVATLLLASLLMTGTSNFAEFTPKLVLWTAGVSYAASFFFAIWLPRARNLIFVAAMQTTWDLILITILVYVTGGAGSVLTFMYGVSVLLSALVIGPRAAAATGATAFALYAGVSTGVVYEWIPTPPDQLAEQYLLSPADLAFSLLSNAIGLLLVALLATNLALRLHRTGTELLKAAENLASLERLNDDIIRSVRGGLVAVDHKGSIHTVNPAGAAILRAEMEELVGEQVEAFIPLPEVGEDSHPELMPRRYEGEATRPDGSKFPIGFSVTPLLGDEYQVLGTLVSFQDLTEIEDLRTTAERAERLAELGRLAASLAHEIRNPLSSISGSVQLVRDSSQLDDDDRHLLGIVLSEVDRLEDLIASILSVGSPKAPRRVDTDISDVARAVVDMARRGPAGSRGITIDCETPDQPVFARVDPDQVRQVLWNLIKNSIQASNEFGSIRVTISAVEDSDVQIEVRDTGHGIALKDQRRVFESFHSRRTHGMGLGLALVKQIVEAHRGRIQVDSQLGAGATFRATLPRIPPSKPPPQSDNRPLDDEQSASSVA